MSTGHHKVSEVNELTSERFQQELAANLAQLPPAAEAMVMNMILNNVSTLLSGIGMGRDLEKKEREKEQRPA